MKTAQELNREYYPLPLEVIDVLIAYEFEVQRLNEANASLQKRLSNYDFIEKLEKENKRLESDLRDIRFYNRIMRNTLRDLSLELDKYLGEKKGG